MEAACPDAATPSVEGGVASVFAGEGSFSTADADAAESGSTTDAAAVALGSTTDAAAAESGVGSAGGSAVTTVTFISASAAAAGGTTSSVRSEESRGGEECGSTCRERGSPENQKKKRAEETLK